MYMNNYFYSIYVCANKHHSVRSNQELNQGPFADQVNASPTGYLATYTSSVLESLTHDTRYSHSNCVYYITSFHLTLRYLRHNGMISSNYQQCRAVWAFLRTRGKLHMHCKLSKGKTVRVNIFFFVKDSQ